jgi:NADH-quinone oxidoreductase subunit N
VNEQLGPLAPELILAVSAVAGLLAGSWLPRRRQWAVRLLAAAACLAALVTTVFTPAGAAATDFGASYAIDTATDAVRVVVAAATLTVICLSGDAMRAHMRETEFYVLLLLAALGTIVLAGANDLLLLFAGYLLASVPGYALAGFRKDAGGTEAALKYYLIGALFGIAMLAGITLLYGAGRGTAYPALPATLARAPHGVVAAGVIAVVAGLLFKAGGVPAHFWIPDVTEGTSAPVAAFVTTVPKIGALAALFRLLAVAIPVTAVNWPMLLAVLAAASMTLGNLAAFFQTSVKRLLAYSTVGQVGYLLMAVTVATASSTALRALLFYLAAYAVTNLAAFAVVAGLPRARTISSYRGLAFRRPGLAAVLVVSLLGLVGTPPTGVFLGKLQIFTAAIDGGYGWLAVLAVANTIASLFYYLRWLAPAFRPRPGGNGAGPGTLETAGRWAPAAAYTAGAASLAVGVAAAVVLPLVTGHLIR